MTCCAHVNGTWMEGVIKGSTIAGGIAVLIVGIGYRILCPSDVMIKEGNQVRAVQPGEKFPVFNLGEVPEPHPSDFEPPQVIVDSVIVQGTTTTTTTTTTTLPPTAFSGSALLPKTRGPSPVLRAEQVEEVSDEPHPSDFERPQVFADAIAADTGAAAMFDPGSEFFKDLQPQFVPWSSELMQPMSTFDGS